MLSGYKEIVGNKSNHELWSEDGLRINWRYLRCACVCVCVWVSATRGGGLCVCALCLVFFCR